MARILQIRRGTTAQNNNFTGLAGELTFDTSAKTLRVHDGATVGGFALARADQSTGGGTSTPCTCTPFDINTVPDSFWQQKVTQFAPTQSGGGTTLELLESRAVAVNSNSSYLEYVFETTKTPIFIKTVLVCQTPEAGYAAGNEVAAFGIDNRTNPQPYTFTDSEGLHVCLMIGHKSYWVSHRNTGTTTTVTDANWRVKFLVYC